MTDSKDFQFDVQPRLWNAVSIPQQWYPGVQNYWPRCTTKRIVGDHIQGMVAIIVHATAGFRSADAVAVMNRPPDRECASFHWLVPDEDEPQHGKLIWTCVRKEDAAWHVRTSQHHPDVNSDI